MGLALPGVSSLEWVEGTANRSGESVRRIQASTPILRRFSGAVYRVESLTRALEEDVSELDGHRRPAVQLQPDHAPLDALSVFVIDDL